jgi:hypothetical protein
MMDRFIDMDGDGVIAGLDCMPKNHKRHMAWAKPEPYDHIEFMSPREFIDMTDTPEYELRKSFEDYYDSETKKREPMEKLGKHIQDPHTHVPIPFIEKSGLHDGRHRAYAAEQAGISQIPVKTPPPSEWRSKIIQQKLDKLNHEPLDGSTWKEVLEDYTWPEKDMDENTKKVYTQTLRDHGLISDDTEQEYLAKKSVSELKEVDDKGICLGHCEEISRRLQPQIEGSEVIEASPIGTTKRHFALRTPDNKIIDTQTWQHHERDPGNLQERKVVFTDDEYKEKYDIKEDTENEE